jgi:phosphoglycerate dehydrogenase-like enzyme
MNGADDSRLTGWSCNRECRSRGSSFIRYATPLKKKKRLTSDLLLEALDAEGGLDSIALDVTDPEPLPDNHPFFTHPRVIITPHTSGGVEGYLDKAADLLIANVEQIRSGGEPINKVDWKKGY